MFISELEANLAYREFQASRGYRVIDTLSPKQRWERERERGRREREREGSHMEARGQPWMSFFNHPRPCFLRECLTGLKLAL